MAKPVFKEYDPNQATFLPPSLEELLAPTHMVRFVNHVIDQMNLEPILSSYKGGGTSSYHPRMMLKILIYGYVERIHSCRAIARAVREQIPFMWLAGGQRPDFRLFRKETSEEGKAVAKSGVASLTIAGLISSGRVVAGEMNSTLLIVLAILEAAGYLYGLVALSAGASQTCPELDLLDGKAEGLTPTQAKIVGREWFRLKQQKQLKEMKQARMNTPKPKDLSDFHYPNRKT